jgi:hypothetical protein
VLAVLVEIDLLPELADGPVDANPRVPLPLEIEEELLVLALAAADDGREHEQTRARRQRHDAVHHLLHGLRGDDLAAARAVRDADASEQHAQVVVDLGHGAHRGPGILRGRLLLDRDRRRQPLDGVHLRLLHLLQELPRVGGERLDVAPLALRIDGVERQGGLAGPGQPGDDHELVPGDLDVDVLEIVLAGPTDDDAVRCHDLTIMPQPVEPARWPSSGIARALSQPSGSASSAG